MLEIGGTLWLCFQWSNKMSWRKNTTTKDSAAAAAKSLQSCLTLCDPIDGSPPGSPIPGILQARTLEWVAISFSNAWKWKVKAKSLSRVRLSTPWTSAHQAPPSMGFSRQEYWSGLPFPSPRRTLGEGKREGKSRISWGPTMDHTFYHAFKKIITSLCLFSTESSVRLYLIFSSIINTVPKTLVT